MGWIEICALWLSCFFDLDLAMFGLITTLRLVVAIVKAIILDKLKSFGLLFIDIVDPCYVDDSIFFDIEERAWDTADCFGIAAVSAVPCPGISTVIKLSIVGSNGFCSLHPDNVLVYVVFTVPFHKFL